MQRSVLLCQWKVPFWTLAPLLCCRVGSRGRTRGPGLAMIHWVLPGTVPFLELLLSLVSTLSGQLKSFPPLRPAYRAKVHPVDMALVTLGMKSRLGVESGQGQWTCETVVCLYQLPPLLYGWPCYSVEVSWSSPPSPVKPKDESRIHLQVRCPGIQLLLQSVRALLEGGLFHSFSISVGMEWLPLWRGPRQPL